MEVVSLILTVAALLASIVFGYLEVIVPFIKGQVKLSPRFPFVDNIDAVPSTKTRRKRRKKKRKQRFFIPMFAVMVLVIAFVLIKFLVFQAHEARRIPIAVIPFKNRTGDEHFDYLCEAIPSLLMTNLGQSQDLRVMTWERMDDLLRDLDSEEVRLIDEELGCELCRMDGIEVIMIGSFSRAGDMFVTEVKVLDVSTKKLLKSSSAKGEGVASIFKMQIDELNKDISKDVSVYERATKPRTLVPAPLREEFEELPPLA